MTQEELDALLNSDITIDESEKSEDEQEKGENADENSELIKEEENQETSDEDLQKIGENLSAENYKIDHESHWPPPPPTSEHKVVRQLDDVTRDSEVKATEIFDKLETISNIVMDLEDALSEFEKFVNSQEEIFQKLHDHFPNFNTFTQKLQETSHIKEVLSKVKEYNQNMSDVSLEAMDIMQYQDIHRQKIERVVNVMRSLSRYMSSLFEGNIDDNKRVGSAVYIQGDDAENALNEDDIEALISSLNDKS
ncbi:MAG: chemotaxis protein [Helicobacter sp.]|nr:chemotaxis protein [Helicobacter sp.]